MKRYVLILLLIPLVLLYSDDKKVKEKKPIITFIELGSVNCIPCKKMQPIMKSIEEKYGEQIKVIFYDVWKDDTKAKEYGVRLIPTQVFLDKNGKEFFRHEGFFPENEIDKLLQSKGLKVVK
jgi:thioredoxin 1